MLILQTVGVTYIPISEWTINYLFVVILLFHCQQ